jgi:ubiquinone/menaquinone biosynthesis C-methylase UbiE
MALKERVLYHPIVWKLNVKVANYAFPKITRRVAGHDVLFLNFGYEEDPPIGLELDASDEPNRFLINLYHATATQAGHLAGKRVLEVGCGHGGGASYLTRTHHPASYTGLDLNPAGIAFCRKRHPLPDLEFVHGNAEDLPFPDESFDALINVESSYCYPQFRVFLAEVARVLCPGGHFLYTDARPRGLVADWEAEPANAPLQMISQRVIDAEVMRGMQTQWQTSSMSGSYRRGLRMIFGVHGDMDVRKSTGYRALESGAFSYRMYCFAKPGADR